LMDLQMPILDGLEATTAIRRFESNRSRPSVPVVAYSSTTPGASVLAKHGLNGSLSKPCDDQQLEDCLVRWCATYRPA
jgi:CheY-like chemotaxis protein